MYDKLTCACTCMEKHYYTCLCTKYMCVNKLILICHKTTNPTLVS